MDTTVYSLSEMIDNPDMCKSFLSFLTVDDQEDRNTDNTKDSSEVMDSLWSMASLNNKENLTYKYYVPGLLPARSPKRPQKTPKKSSANYNGNKITTSSRRMSNGIEQKMQRQTTESEFNKQNIEDKKIETTKENTDEAVAKNVTNSTEKICIGDTHHIEDIAKSTTSSTEEYHNKQHTLSTDGVPTNKAISTDESTTENNEQRMPNLNSTQSLSQSIMISESQAVNVDILMELANSSDDEEKTTQQERKPSDYDDDDVFPSSGFCVPISAAQDDKVTLFLCFKMNLYLNLIVLFAFSLPGFTEILYHFLFVKISLNSLFISYLIYSFIFPSIH